MQKLERDRSIQPKLYLLPRVCRLRTEIHRANRQTFRRRYNEHLQPCKNQNSNQTFRKTPTQWSPGTYHGQFRFIKRGELMNSLEKKNYICFEILRNDQMNEESTAGSSNTYSVVTQSQSDRCRVCPGTSSATVTPPTGRS